MSEFHEIKEFLTRTFNLPLAGGVISGRVPDGEWIVEVGERRTPTRVRVVGNQIHVTIPAQ